ncbi:major facilitator superfamily domain-containing protein [Mycena vitilis]|nr:major facilitator superfamily domain-containing protein [Mycena vitilis]
MSSPSPIPELLPKVNGLVPPRPYALDARRAWSSLLGGCLFQFAVLGPVFAFGVFQDLYLAEFLPSYSASDISWIGSIQLFLGLGCGALAGMYYDSGHGRPVLICGSVVYVLSFFLLSITRENQYYQVFLSQGLGMGLGCSWIYVPTCTLISHHFKARKAMAMGILLSNAPLGGVMYTIMLNHMIHQGPGLQWAVRAAALLTTSCFIFAHLLITVPPPTLTNAQARESFIQSIANIPYALALLAGFVAQLGSFFPTFYLQTFAETHRFSPTLTFYAPVIMNVATIFGRMIPNFLADRWGALDVYIVCVGANGLVGFLMLAGGHTSGLISFAIFFGFFFGSTIALYLPVIATLVPREGHMGRIMGIALFPIGFATLIGPPIAGAILGPQLVWWRGIVFASIALVVGSLILSVVRIAHRRRQRIKAAGSGPSLESPVEYSAKPEISIAVAEASVTTL